MVLAIMVLTMWSKVFSTQTTVCERIKQALQWGKKLNYFNWEQQKITSYCPVSKCSKTLSFSPFPNHFSVFEKFQNYVQRQEKVI